MIARQGSATYVPGTWLAIAAGHTWLLADLPPQHELVQRCWTLMSSGASADEVLDALISGGIRAAPDFVLVALGGKDPRVVVRGSATAALDADDLDRVLVRATERAVWEDVIVDAALTSIVLGVDVPGPAPVELPMSSGVVMASAIRVQIGLEPLFSVVDPGPIPDSVHLADAIAVQAPVPPQAGVAIRAEPATVPILKPEPTVAHDEGPVTLIDAPVSDRRSTYDHLLHPTVNPASLPALDGPLAEDNNRNDNEPAVEAPLDQPKTALTATYREEVIDEHPVVDASTPTAGGLIDHVPWSQSVPQPKSEEPRHPPGVVVAEAAPRPSGVGPVVAELPDDVVMTVGRSTLQRPDAAVSWSGPTVIAGYCPQGHLSPAFAPQCRVCGQPMPPQDGFEIARPALGRLRLSTGDVVTLDRGVLLGRSPDASRSSEERPHLLRLSTPNNDISRSHAEIVLEGWNVYVRDLGSMNGTIVSLPAQAPVRLRVSELQLLEHGSRVDLADDCFFTFEVMA